MKIYYLLVAFYIACQLSLVNAGKMVCYYDTYGPKRPGTAKFTSKDMETVLQFCSYVVYSHVIVAPNTFAVTYLAKTQEQDFLNVAKFKTKFPSVKFLLSISGNKNASDTEHFLKLLDADHKIQQTFVNTAVNMVRKFKFDGLSLDLQLPTEAPRKVHPYYVQIWKSITHFFSPSSVKDDQAITHKRELADLVQQLSGVLKQNNLILSLNVLPNVKSKVYFDTSVITQYLDFIILSAFDFYTPNRNPEEADYMAPIYAPIKTGHRLPQANIEQLVTEWTQTLKVPSEKLILGIAAYGRAWEMTNASKITGLPPVAHTNGSAPAGPITHTRGFLSYPEICEHFPKPNEKNITPWTRVVDPTRKYGNYAYRPAEKYPGVWISYEDPLTAAFKVDYAKNHNLGGVALFDITLDDLRGRCNNGDTFPILRSIVIKLLQ
ncbi:chitinase-like protein Idgf3 [Cochliomyia hominivorax]